MPELPEVTVHAERLNQLYHSQTIVSVSALAISAMKNLVASSSQVRGQQIQAISSHGKYLIIEGSPYTFVVHLMQGGRLTPDTKNSRKPRGGLFRWAFEQGPSLLLTEAGKEHRAGVWGFSDRVGAGEALFAELGPPANEISAAELEKILSAAGGSRIHGVLRDQRAIAGLGRRLANEICWTARISPFASATSVRDRHLTDLHSAIVNCVDESIIDERSRDVMVNSANRLAHVHHRDSQPCDRCGDQIRTVSYNVYTVFYCATCQTDGKILADNTTSKFLK